MRLFSGGRCFKIIRHHGLSCQIFDPEDFSIYSWGLDPAKPPDRPIWSSYPYFLWAWLLKVLSDIENSIDSIGCKEHLRKAPFSLKPLPSLDRAAISSELVCQWPREETWRIIRFKNSSSGKIDSGRLCAESCCAIWKLPSWGEGTTPHILCPSANSPYIHPFKTPLCFTVRPDFWPKYLVCCHKIQDLPYRS